MLKLSNGSATLTSANLTNSLAPILTPQGHLRLTETGKVPPLEPVLAQRLRGAFERGSGHSLLQLGAGEVGTPLPLPFFTGENLVRDL